MILLHRDKPLRSRTENDRRLVAPAMRITVLDRMVMQELAFRLQDFDHMLVRFEHVLAGEQFGRGQKYAVASDRVIDRQTISKAGDIVFLTVAGRGMHGAG